MICMSGNVLIFQLAGHETTAHTLGFALGLLAIHTDVQDKLYEHIKGVCKDGRVPVSRTLAFLVPFDD